LYRPPRPGTPRLDFTSDPTPDLQDDPIGDRFDDPANPEQDACQCDKKPKKKKKKPQERDVCRQGTYTQRKKGIKYAPRRVVPCEGEIQPENKSSKSKPKRRRFVPSLSDILSTPL